MSGLCQWKLVEQNTESTSFIDAKKNPDHELLKCIPCDGFNINCKYYNPKKREKKMTYENDFVDETPINITIGGRIFKYKPTISGEENEWLKDTMVYNPDLKRSVLDWGLHNIKKLSNVLSVPYTDEQVKKLTKLDKKWIDLAPEEKYLVFKKLKTGIFDKLITAINETDAVDEEALKN